MNLRATSWTLILEESVVVDLGAERLFSLPPPLSLSLSKNPSAKNQSTVGAKTSVGIDPVAATTPIKL